MQHSYAAHWAGGSKRHLLTIFKYSCSLGLHHSKGTLNFVETCGKRAHLEASFRRGINGSLPFSLEARRSMLQQAATMPPGFAATMTIIFLTLPLLAEAAGTLWTRAAPLTSVNHVLP